MAALIGPRLAEEPMPEPEPEPETALFHRRIEFHAAKKPFNGFVNTNVNGFKLVTLNSQSGHLIDTGLGKKPEKSDLLDNGLDSELGFEITFRRIGAGLRNLGNTCFLNSVLQCLTYTEPLAAYLQSGKHQSSCRTAGFCALCAIQKHVSRALQATGRILEPKDLVSNLRCISRNFRNARQEDAHEYMVNLLETMHKCCLPSGVPSESPGAYDKSLVHKIFGGRLRSQVKCMQCSFSSNKFDPFLDLSLEIAKADSLDKALHHFTAKEMLDGGERVYQCQQCKQKVKALKQLTVHKAPNVLAVHLKRFGSHVQGQKINKKVSFAPTMDLKPFVSGPYDGDLNYTLYGVLVHAGWSTHSGHYYCFVRTSSGMWYSLDDNQVVQVSEKRVLEQKAYMLFYFRDRSRSIPRKPGNVAQKENMPMNAVGNAACSKPPADSKGILPERNAQTSDLPEKTPLKTMNFQNIPSKAGVDALSVKASESTLTSASKTSKEALKEPMNVDSLGHKTSLTVSDSTLTSALQTTKEASREPMNVDSLGNKTSLSSTSEGAKDDANLGADAKSFNADNSSKVVQNLNNDASVVPSVCSEPMGHLHSKESNAFTTDNEEGLIDKSQSVSASGSVLCNSASGDIPKVDSENTQMPEGSPRKIGLPPTDENHTNRVTDIALQPTPALAAENKSQSLPEILKKQKAKLKVKTKPLKRRVATACLSSGILFGAALFQQKDKRRKKRRSQKKKSRISKDPSSEDAPSVAGESSVPLSICRSSDSPTKKDSLVSNDKSGNSGGQTHNTVNNEVGERVARSSNTMATETKPHAIQMDVMSFLTRSSEETTVARWDDASVSTQEKFEMLAQGTTAQIGYIGDEWDEEYDRGKRKKVRGPKMEFGGPNLFQEIAENLKRAKVDKSRYVNNKPFRI